jgi:hypothetical protein
MAAGDIVITADVLLGDRKPTALRLIAGTVTLDGGNPTPIALSGYMTAVLTAVVCIEGSAATGADPNQVSCAVSGTTINVYAWKVTTGGAAGNPTEVASANNSRLINFIAVGPSV